MLETSIALRRAGADLLITYFARELAGTLGGRAADALAGASR
jgi:delta-aminolevulinic acid dehydratase/porphobilinogen synthase